MDERREYQPGGPPARRWLHSIWLRALGFIWILTACLFLVVGCGLAFLGVGGHLLVRARPDTGNVINYDPSTIATFSPLPIAVGLLLLLGFVLRARRL
jgi:hypothetical protein